MAVLYRALISRVHRQRWSRGQYTSFHQTVPGRWIDIWRRTQSQDPADYALQCSEGVFTEGARAAFLRLAPNHTFEFALPKEEAEPIGELAGVCAFTEPLAAYRYGTRSCCGRNPLFAEFEGEILWSDRPSGGIVARVQRVIGVPLSSAEFRAKHALPE